MDGISDLLGLRSKVGLFPSLSLTRAGTCVLMVIPIGTNSLVACLLLMKIIIITGEKDRGKYVGTFQEK